MKKYQRLRFYALVAKQSGGTALNALESAEFKTLASLVALHPSADSDTDETDDEKKKREDKEKEDAKAKGADEETDEDKKKREDKEKEAAKGAKPSLSACIAAAMNGLKGGTSAELVAQNKALTADLATAKASLKSTADQLTASGTQLTAVNAQLSAICGFLGIAVADLSGKTAEDVTKILTAKISAETVIQVGALGYAAKDLPAPNADTTGGGTTKAELWATYNGLTGKEQDAFYTKHSKKMLG